jgi:hypothetical protein
MLILLKMSIAQYFLNGRNASEIASCKLVDSHLLLVGEDNVLDVSAGLLVTNGEDFDVDLLALQKYSLVQFTFEKSFLSVELVSQ